MIDSRGKALNKCKPRCRSRLGSPGRLAGLIDMTLQVGGEICTGNRSGAEAVQVLRGHLAVDEYETPGLQSFDQGDRKIGRASCREREQISVGAVSLKKK